METTTTGPRTPDPFFDPYRMRPGHGGPIDWARVGAYFYELGKFTVKVNGAVAIGAVAVIVDPLEYPLLKGVDLDFGTYAPVVVTTPAGAILGAVSIPVNALSGPIPAGTRLDFTGPGEFALTTAAVAAGAVAIPVEALDAAIEAADTATFPGGDVGVRLAADAAAGDVSLTTEPVQFPIADNAEAIAKRRDAAIGRRIPKGTAVCKTAAGLWIPRRDGSGAATEVASALLVSDADERSVSDAKSGYGVIIGGTPLYENLMPDADSITGLIPAGYKTELVTAGCTFTYLTYQDSRLA